MEKKFQEAVSVSKIAEMEKFLVVTTLKSLGNCEHKGWSPPQIFLKMNFYPITHYKASVCRKNLKNNRNGFTGGSNVTIWLNYYHPIY